MNGNAQIWDSFVGKTISKVEYSNESYEDTWTTLHFTDGTSFKISAEASHAMDLALEVYKGKD